MHCTSGPLEASAPRSGLLSLPAELLLHVSTFLSTVDDLAYAATNRHLRSIVLDARHVWYAKDRAAPLWHAVKNVGMLDLARRALAVGIDPEEPRAFIFAYGYNLILPARYSPGETPLLGAIRCNNVALVKLLLDHGADPSTRGYNQDGTVGDAPLTRAARRGDLTIASMLLACRDEAPPKFTISFQQSMMRTRDSDGSTALHVAGAGDYEQVASFLIPQGASVAARNGYGLTPLHVAIQAGSLAVVQLLLRAGADPRLTDYKNDSAVDIAEAYVPDHGETRLSVLGAVLMAATKLDSSKSSLYLATGTSDVVKALLDAGIPPDTDTKRNGSALIKRARTPELDEDERPVAQLLVDAGADVNYMCTIDNMTPLLYAADSANVQMTQLLLENGTSVTASDSNGISVLEYAASAGYHETVSLLIDYILKGYNEDTTLQQELKWADHRDRAPLMIALDDQEYVSFEIVDALLEHDATLTQTKSHQNDSLLSLVIATDDTEILELITRRTGIDINKAVDVGSKTPLEVAVIHGSFRIAIYLLNRGASVDVSISPDDSANYTPLVTAIEKENYEMAVLLLKHNVDLARALRVAPDLLQDLQSFECAAEMTELLRNYMSSEMVEKYCPEKE